MDSLITMTADNLPVNSCGNAETVSLPASDGKPINILIVDDEPKNLTVLEVVLDDPGYRLVRAESADLALLALIKEEFALIILDIRMPGMTGFELAMMIKERKKTAYVPIIFLTAYYNEDQHVLEGYHTGAVDYLHKPVNPIILRSKVAVFAELYRKNRECAQACQTLLAEMTMRRRAQKQLRKLNDALEQRIAERTAALLTANVTLMEASERYRSVFEGSLDSIISLDKEGRFDAANPAMLQLTGIALDKLKTLNFLDICAPEQHESAKNSLRTSFSGERIIMDTTVISASGEHRDLVLSGVPVMVGENVVGLSCIARDMTERNLLERTLLDKNVELQSATSVAEKANLAKSEFLSSMSHELRTPMNAILGFAQLIDAGPPPPNPQQKLFIDHILKAGYYLLELINEILDLAKIESGNLSLSLEQVSLPDILLDCQAMSEGQAKKHGITMIFSPFTRPCLVQVDRMRLQQILANLLSNAIKYNKAGGTVEVYCFAPIPSRLRICVQDTGPGLPPELLTQLFQPFNRLGQQGGGVEGTGIGLVVCKRLVELMGGSIGVESTVGKGSLFWIEVATALAPSLDPPSAVFDTPAPALSPDAGPTSTLLCVEDNPANLMLVQQIMVHRPNIRMLSASNGLRGIEMARAVRPDIILLDINLPDLNGYTVLRKLADDPATANIPVVAVSANAMSHDVAKGLAAGFFRYITKPIKVPELLDTVDMALAYAKTKSHGTDQAAPS